MSEDGRMFKMGDWRVRQRWFLWRHQGDNSRIWCHNSWLLGRVLFMIMGNLLSLHFCGFSGCQWGQCVNQVVFWIWGAWRGGQIIRRLLARLLMRFCTLQHESMLNAPKPFWTVIRQRIARAGGDVAFFSRGLWELLWIFSFVLLLPMKDSGIVSALGAWHWTYEQCISAKVADMSVVPNVLYRSPQW